ncbi:hypothetical protein SAMN04244579_02721 [Azotobacter beijerinckii]|uniref:Phage tail lysozyme domain-containing protein n=1 Tax=Azotobacter beijerinckii TaxID=170623 RepID=A0A1H6V353_9GAMM|nr:phage tail tip lysozyme [Azotobacter beijerinckii]SEI99013.1 hypothetical protein SAMN04244579_02721 [Azotobacter beijerinckii]
MAESEVIKEFLVGLGFKVDEKGLKTFTGGIGSATKAVTNLVTTLAGASLTIAAGVSAFASNLEGLYFASQRVGASAESLKAADYAARDLGASAQEVRGSLEGMARFLRDNPGGEGFLQSLGVQTRDAQGNIKDTTDLLIGLGQRLSAMPWYQARQYASVLGIDENTLRAIMSGEFARKVEENRRSLSRSGLDQASKDAHEFMTNLREVGREFEVLSILIQSELMRSLGPELKDFANWLEQNGPMIAEQVGDVAESIFDLAEQSGPYLSQTVQFFRDLDEATDGWSTKLLIAAGVLKVLGGGGLLKAIPGLASLLPVGAAAAGGWAAGTWLNEQIDKAISKAAGKETTLGAWIYDALHPDQGGPEDPAKNIPAQGASGMAGRDLATFAMDFFRSKGWSNAQSAGLVANLTAESNLDPAALGDFGRAKGIAQWHPDRQQAFKNWAGFSLWDKQADIMKQLEFVQYELTQGAEQKAGRLLQAAQNARDAGSVVSRYYERPGIDEAAKDEAAAKRGAMAVQLNQRTEIHVSGGSDPSATARAVAGEQDRVNQELARNMNTAVN